MKQKLLGMFQVNFLYFDEICKMKEVGAKKILIFSIICKIAQNQGFWVITDSFVRFHRNKKKFEQ